MVQFKLVQKTTILTPGVIGTGEGEFPHQIHALLLMMTMMMIMATCLRKKDHDEFYTGWAKFRSKQLFKTERTSSVLNDTFNNDGVAGIDMHKTMKCKIRLKLSQLGCS